MKIVAIDNFNRDHISDRLIADNVPKFYGEHIIEYLNNAFSGNHSQVFFKLVEDNHKLYEFEP